MCREGIIAKKKEHTEQHKMKNHLDDAHKGDIQINGKLNSNQLVVPGAKQALDSMKAEMHQNSV